MKALTGNEYLLKSDGGNFSSSVGLYSPISPLFVDLDISKLNKSNKGIEIPKYLFHKTQGNLLISFNRGQAP